MDNDSIWVNLFFALETNEINYICHYLSFYFILSVEVYQNDMIN